MLVQPCRMSCSSLSRLLRVLMDTSVTFCSSHMYRCLRCFILPVTRTMEASVSLEHRVRLRYSISETVADSHYTPSSLICTHPST